MKLLCCAAHRAAQWSNCSQNHLAIFNKMAKTLVWHSENKIEILQYSVLASSFQIIIHWCTRSDVYLSVWNKEIELWQNQWCCLNEEAHLHKVRAHADWENPLTSLDQHHCFKTAQHWPLINIVQILGDSYFTWFYWFKPIFTLNPWVVINEHGVMQNTQPL